jgi:hypothetical protein
MAGAIVMEAARRKGVVVLPVDSEHNAIHQCLHGRAAADVRRLILTASGGPFRDLPIEDIQRVTPEEALRHPTWTMGPKITIDSATLMNKGLEVIEARWLFDCGPEQIAVLVHPQSIVHSMVEFVDGSIIAQLGVTDMRLPIQYAFSYPERWSAPLPPLDLARAGPAGFRRAGYDEVSLSGAGIPCAGGRRRPADRAQCRERSSGVGVPRAPDWLCRDPRIDLRGDGQVRAAWTSAGAGTRRRPRHRRVGARVRGGRSR